MMKPFELTEQEKLMLAHRNWLRVKVQLKTGSYKKEIKDGNNDSVCGSDGSGSCCRSTSD